MRVVTFNIKHGRRRRWGIDLGLLTRTCAGLRADVLALQEVDVRQVRTRLADQAARVAEGTGMAHVFGASLRRCGGWYGNALLVRGAVVEHATIRLPQQTRELRSCILARVDVDAAVLSVAVTHLSTHRREAMAQLEVVAGLLAFAPAPRLVLGDFNLEPPQVEPIVAAAGLTLVAHGPTFPNDGPRRAIDHVAHDAFTVHAVATPATPSSDHRPLVVDLS